jgi:hypothetical protein
VTVPAAFARLVDDAAVFPPGDAPLPEATAAYAARSGDERDLVGTFVLKDTDVPLVRGLGGALSVVVTGGAGQLAGPAGLCDRLGLELGGLEVAVRDLDDPVGAVRRITTAAVDLPDVPLSVELPPAPPGGGWLAAADEVAAAGARLKFRTGGLEPHAFPTSATLAGWLDAALDRETPFKCTAGLHHAVRHTDPATGFEHHGFLNVLVATRLLFDGATTDDAVVVLEQRDPAPLLAAADGLDLAGARRWFTSFGSCSVAEPLADLRQMGLLDD